MIKINMLSKEQQALAAAVDKFNQQQYSKSFSQRNPHLGKMIKCKICNLRHRSSVKHEENQ